MMAPTHDLIIIGAGPAGMSAAISAAALGLKTLLLDEQPHPGGQIYRHVTQVPPRVAAVLGPDYLHGRGLAERLQQCGVDYRSGALVWEITQDLVLTVQQDERSYRLRARQIIAATGAMERPSPLPGWTLPGVLNAGAAQIAMKTSASVPQGPVVLAGAGPLLLLVACQLLEAGAEVTAVVQTSPPENLRRALPHLAAALGAAQYLMKGLKMLWRLRRAGVPLYQGASALRIEGKGQAERVRFSVGARDHTLAAKVVLLHHGVVPNTQLSRQLRLDHRWDALNLCWTPVVDEGGQTSLEGLRIAGDGAGIAGARAAESAGIIAAAHAALAIGKSDAAACAALIAQAGAERARHLKIRPFLDTLYRPPQWLASPPDEAIVCRCEEVSAGQIREMARLGCQGPNQTKFFSRCGMGPCQGRMCGLSVTQILAQELGKPPEEVGAYHIRTPLKPIALASLAALADTEPLASE
ncbi:BFD-like protein [Herbaspirillum sp. GW103]|jgi:NADPH-dependent 2,4-dienoyl-CoA reductase/sulfur reductase-like enzyme|uniref:NAD(P)/FAD-dependent oxidoreductase n=1 Tax=unclassified Herbaspirillum TaxID=2624150 RepID=UPI00025E4614|nr:MULTISPECIES: NAD(P)/FAD-dependent oxidoreductase [unclassified Herbaspirillum]EIJ44410.1 BFD-like protein [Herbaspirillum sp. GW103]MCI1004422.1 FAD-dependent oxidoreductase [Herbaspirillum sp. C7C8]